MLSAQRMNCLWVFTYLFIWVCNCVSVCCSINHDHRAQSVTTHPINLRLVRVFVQSMCVCVCGMSGIIQATRRADRGSIKHRKTLGRVCNYCTVPCTQSFRGSVTQISSKPNNMVHYMLYICTHRHRHAHTNTHTYFMTTSIYLTKLYSRNSFDIFFMVTQKNSNPVCRETDISFFYSAFKLKTSCQTAWMQVIIDTSGFKPGCNHKRSSPENLLLGPAFIDWPLLLPGHLSTG